jgi:colanic acid/amylovoran biosynthesis glycosyltransferase
MTRNPAIPDALLPREAVSSRDPRGRSVPSKVAYIVSRFPKLTETFVLYELIAVENEGIEVELYPLWRERTALVHPEATSWVERARFQPALSRRILAAHLRFIFTRGGVYFGTLWTLLRANLGSLRYLLGALATFPKVVFFASEMASRGVTHVHAHFASHPAAAAFVIHRLTGIPYSFTAHGSDLHRDRHMLSEKVAEARFVVAISEFNREVIVQECGEPDADRLIVLHCGVDTDFFAPPQPDSNSDSHSDSHPDSHPDSEEALPGDPFKILCVGTLHEVKGQSQLIDACRELSERGVDFVCDLLGDGPDRAALARRCESAGISNRVRFLGKASRADVAAAFRRSDVVVAASVPTQNGRREGIPVVLMEAAATAKPVVASRLSGIPELIEDGRQGLLVPPRDVRALADALEELYRDPKERERLGREGRKKVMAEFDLRQSAAELARRFAGGAER